MPLASPQPLPLRWHLVRLVSGTLLPVVAFAAVVAFQLARAERGAVERRAVHSARALAESFEREMSGSIQALHALGESDRLDRGELASFQVECERVLRAQSSWRHVVLLSPEGQPLVNTAYSFGTALPALAERESFEHVLSTRQPLVGSLAMGRGARKQFAFPVRVPVLREGVLRYVLTAVITPQSLAGVVDSPSSDSGEWTRVLVDREGTVVARTREPERFVGKTATPPFLDETRAVHEGMYADVSMDGASVYVAFSHSSPSGWTAAIVTPRQLLDAPVWDSMLTVGGLGLVLLLVSASGAWVFSRRLESSISEASSAATALAEGNPRRMEPSSVRELARLGEALERSRLLLREREGERDAHLASAEAARAEAVAATRAKDAFLAMLGHELRNPLAPIVTSLELLRRRGLAGTPEHEVISRQLRHVVRLVDDLLDVARITRGKMSLRLEPLELASVVTRAVEAVSPLIDQRRHALEVHVPSSGLLVLADEDRLTQVVSNLLTNAVRYTPPGGHIWLRAHDHEGGIALAVEDDGRGIPPELRSRIFEPFVQGPRSLDRSEGGLGIGLALVRSLVQAHGGHVGLHSDGPGQGSTFTVWLPRHVQADLPVLEEARKVSVAHAAGTAPEHPMRVLVVDDNVDAAEALAELLGLSGYEVAVAHDCEGALSRAEAFRPEMALLDIGLPKVDGYGVAERIRARLGPTSPVFAALTGFGQETDRARSVAAGFRQHFVKPIDIDELTAFIESLRPARSGAA